MTGKRFAIRVMAGAAMFIAILLLSMVGTASAAHAFAYGFRGPSVITETSQKDPMFQTEHMHDFFCANNVTDPTSYDALVGGHLVQANDRSFSVLGTPAQDQRHSPEADPFGFLLPVLATLHRPPVRQRHAVS